MTNRQKKKLRTYHGRLFESKEEGQKWLDRMRGKMGDSYTYELVRNPTYEMWHGKLYKEETV